MQPSYVVLFKTHFWDEFAQRQFDRLKSCVGRGDLYVTIDETFQPAPPIPHDKVLRITSGDIAELRLAPITTHGSILWYNIDYPQYVAMTKLPAYDYYIALEYDVIVNHSLDTLIDRLSADGVDLLSFPQRIPAPAWPWYTMHLPIYGEDMLTTLACFAVFSRRALELLLARRQAHGEQFSQGALAFWPNNEAFLPNEVNAAGFKRASLADYGSTEQYDWWPPTNESELAMGGSPAFLHPVLHGTRYIRSLAHHEPSLGNFFRRDSSFRRKVAGLDPAVVRPIVRQEIRRRIGEKFGRILERLGLRRRWYSNAQVETQRSEQQATLHNRS